MTHDTQVWGLLASQADRELAKLNQGPWAETFVHAIGSREIEQVSGAIDLADTAMRVAESAPVAVALDDLNKAIARTESTSWWRRLMRGRDRARLTRALAKAETAADLVRLSISQLQTAELSLLSASEQADEARRHLQRQAKAAQGRDQVILGERLADVSVAHTVALQSATSVALGADQHVRALESLTVAIAAASIKETP